MKSDPRTYFITDVPPEYAGQGRKYSLVVPNAPKKAKSPVVTGVIQEPTTRGRSGSPARTYSPSGERLVWGMSRKNHSLSACMST